MKIDIARANRRLRRYRPNVELRFKEDSMFGYQCRVFINDLNVAMAVNWKDACKLAVEAWLAEDSLKKEYPFVVAQSGQPTTGKMLMILQPGFSPVMVGMGKDWNAAIASFRANIAKGISYYHTQIPSSLLGVTK